MQVDGIKFPYSLAVIGYGSAHFTQLGHRSSRDTRRDYMMIVDDPSAWHKENIKINPSHYPLFLRKNQILLDFIQPLGSETVHLFTPLEKLKYGVVAANVFLSDLVNWDTLFHAGRLHKPVSISINSSKSLNSHKVSECVALNRKFALQAALLMLPQRFSFRQMLREIVGLSYLGDPRFLTGIGEDPLKVDRIVAGQIDLLTSIYRPLLKSCHDVKNVGNIDGDCQFWQDVSAVAKLAILTNHPLKRAFRDPFLICKSNQMASETRRAIVSITRIPSIKQALKGVLTAGPTQALLYAFSKIKRSLT